MMRHLLLLCCLAAVTSCGPPLYVAADPSYPSAPGYVYTYPDGGCWANDIWYGACPWRTGPSYGYYGYGNGRYDYRPGYAWPYRPYAPPPRHWREPPVQHPPSRPPPQNRPPVTRDHRSPRR